MIKLPIFRFLSKLLPSGFKNQSASSSTPIGNTKKQSSNIESTDMDDSHYAYDEYDASKHLQPELSKKTFEEMKGFELGWALLEPINLASSPAHEKELSKQFSPAQKALYFFWFLDAQVTNGGFQQFYINGYRRYLIPIKAGLAFLNDHDMLAVVEQADKIYLNHIDAFPKDNSSGNFSEAYAIKAFDECESQYYDLHEKTMALIEQYARQHPADFVKLK